MKNSGAPDARAEAARQFSGEKDETQSSDYFMLTYFLGHLRYAIERTVEACAAIDGYTPPPFNVSGQISDTGTMNTRFMFSVHASDMGNSNAKATEFGQYLDKLIALNMQIDDVEIAEKLLPSGHVYELSAENPSLFVHFVYRLMNRFDLECTDTIPKPAEEAPHPFVKASQPEPQQAKTYLSFSIRELQDIATQIGLRLTPAEHAQEQRFNPRSQLYAFH